MIMSTTCPEQWQLMNGKTQQLNANELERTRTHSIWNSGATTAYKVGAYTCANVLIESKWKSERARNATKNNNEKNNNNLFAILLSRWVARMQLASILIGTSKKKIIKICEIVCVRTHVVSIALSCVCTMCRASQWAWQLTIAMSRRRHRRRRCRTSLKATMCGAAMQSWITWNYHIRFWVPPMPTSNKRRGEKIMNCEWATAHTRGRRVKSKNKIKRCKK